MRTLVLLWGCLALRASATLTCPKEVSGFEGGTVSLRCTYGDELRPRQKYWCKEVGLFISRCSSKIFTGESGQETTEGRVSIQDSPQELTLTVTLRDLTLEDSGKYWCGAHRLGLDDTFQVSLTVFPGAERPAGTTRACCPPSPAPSFWPPPATTASLQPRAGARPTHPPAPRSSRPAMVAEPSSSTAAGNPGPVSSSRSSASSVSIPMARLLAPVLVLLALLLAAGLIALGAHALRGQRPAGLAVETQQCEKVHLPATLLGSSWVPEDTVVSLAGPSTEIRCPGYRRRETLSPGPRG